MSILKLLALINIGYISLIFGLATRSRFVRIYICFPLSFLVFSHVAFVDSLDQPTPNDRLNPCVVGLNGILRAFELLLCSGDPYIAFVRLEDKKKDIKVVEQSYWARIKWALSLSCSQRGGGWNWRVAGAPRLPPRTTTVFVLHSFIRWISNYLGLELLSIIFGYLGSPVTLRGPLVILHAVMVYTALHATYEPGCIAWVLLGFGSMEECPPLYGKLRDAKTLKGFWGKSWHQCFRQVGPCFPSSSESPSDASKVHHSHTQSSSCGIWNWTRYHWNQCVFHYRYGAS
jgi:hypothetical protein